MPIDSSIYQSLRPTEMPSLLDSQQKAMNLSGLAMQNRRAVQQDQFAQKQEQAFDREQAVKAHQERSSVIGNAMESLAGMSPQDRAANYPKVRNQLVGAGVIRPEDAPPDLDEGFFRQTLMQYRNSNESLSRQKTQAEIDKLKADATRERKERNPALLTPAERLAKAGGDVKQKIGFLTGGLQALTRYEDEFRKGGRQNYINQSTPLIGEMISSTPIDEARTSMEEAIGRLASGGAINSGEETRFRRMLPKAADKEEDYVRKLVNLRKEMEGKLTAYGFQTKDLPELGYQAGDLGYGGDYASLADRGLLAPKDKGSPGPAIGAQNAYAAPPPVRQGEVEDGYVFMGGDRADPKNWKKAH